MENSKPALKDALPARALIVGCGDVGLRVAQRLLTMGREVTGVVRSDQSAADLTQAGVTTLQINLDTEAPPANAPLLFWFAPPSNAGSSDLRLRRFLDANPDSDMRIVYISTSGVYGDCEGRWIDEDAPLQPISARAQRRLDAEQALAMWGGDYVILRVPGIYGPGRLPVERLQKQLPVVRAEESPFTNRIHSDDLAEAALHAAAYGTRTAAYNISDGNPTTMCDYFTRCAALLDLPPPPQVSMDEARRIFTPAMWSFMEESKRLKNERMLQQLGFEPRYPDLARGLAHCVGT
ncbi:SDR family oxidoreductase [Stenotrophobium rhamnosiphilum]|uniref:NAD(P)-dependent oxidoreductase n=1 Tax=Stenotrophobium rhamnosiphilum TaxID=2029166 RepID=A0A2T5MFU8_9GAMM|nr:SDR family oxidoreductase [Stenotrophobium rhamnosiphilum]PTU31454.1 NAD(P)-dependent oxidoreductase [Stenotrophobium rhamnosiphilum]